MLGRTFESVGEFVKVAGTAIRTIEEGVHAVMGLLLKPMLPILEPLLKPLGAALERLSGFLRRLLGIAEKESSHVAAAVASRTEGALAHGGPAPHPTVAPHSEPHVAPTTSSPAAKPPATTPTAHAAEVKSPAKAVAFVEEHPSAVKGEAGHRHAEVGGGHEVVEVPDATAPSGIGCEVHSPPPFVKVPCPTGMGSRESGKVAVKEPEIPEDTHSVRDSPHPGRSGEGAQIGNFVHDRKMKTYERLRELIPGEPHVTSDIIPPDAIPEYKVRRYGYPPGREPSIDRLDRGGKTVIEIKPSELYEQGLAEAKVYAQDMDRLEPLPNGERWQAKCVTYDYEAVRAYMKRIGLLE